MDNPPNVSFYIKSQDKRILSNKRTTIKVFFLTSTITAVILFMNRNHINKTFTKVKEVIQEVSFDDLNENIFECHLGLDIHFRGIKTV